jgi:hypothetical protein
MQGFNYCYLRCGSCSSLVGDPPPDDNVLTQLYSVEYASSFPDGYEINSPKSTSWVREQLGAAPPKTFVDFGCGDRSLLTIAVAGGWRAYGVELDPEVAQRTSETTGCPVLCTSELSDAEPASMVHLGDVLEHLPDPSIGLAQALDLLEAGGTVLVQGPLEAGPTLFSSVVRPGRRRRDHAIEMAPHHLIQATIRGQRQFFRRAGLIEQSYDVFEVDWPAPSRLARGVIAHPRTLALFALRRLSKWGDHLLGATPLRRPIGNRFQYVGHGPIREHC